MYRFLLVDFKNKINFLAHYGIEQEFIAKK